MQLIATMDELSFWIDTLSSIVTDSFYVIDVAESRICFIKPDDPFLCGYSSEDAIRLGYDFYKKIVHTDDLSLWVKMREAVFSYLHTSDARRDEADFFSCTFRLQRTYSFTSRLLPQMIYHRMKPVWSENELRYLICSAKNSSVKETGNLCVYKKDRCAYDAYDFKSGRWKQKVITPLTERESALLILFGQGKTAREIAKEYFFRGFHTIRNQIRAIFEKLNVHSMQEALECAVYYRMSHPRGEVKPQPGNEEQNKRRYVLYAEEKKQHVRQHLCDGISIRRTAALEGVPESTIRDWIKKGKINMQGLPLPSHVNQTGKTQTGAQSYNKNAQ